MPPITSVLLAAGLALPPRSDPAEVRPRPLAWEELPARAFDPAWLLPERRRAGRDLLAEMERLVDSRFELELGGGRVARTFGDLLVAAREVPPAEREAWLARLAEADRGWLRDWLAGVRELVLDDHLHSDRWDPLADHARDGLLIADDWELSDGYGAPWSELDVAPRVAQAAAVIRADLTTVKAVERDYRTYEEHVGADHEDIRPIPGRFFRGEDPLGAPFAAHAIRFEGDLPFPFTGYTCRLRILDRIDAAGRARTDVYSTSSDFHWLAGRDVYLPVADGDGETVALLVVRQYGFDLAGVPDEPRHRTMALRASLGNLVRKAEARFAANPREHGAPAEALAAFRVLGGEP